MEGSLKRRQAGRFDGWSRILFTAGDAARRVLERVLAIAIVLTTLYTASVVLDGFGAPAPEPCVEGCDAPAETRSQKTAAAAPPKAEEKQPSRAETTPPPADDLPTEPSEPLPPAEEPAPEPQAPADEAPPEAPAEEAPPAEPPAEEAPVDEASVGEDDEPPA